MLSTRAARLLSGPTPFLLAGALVIGAGVIGGASTLFDEARWMTVASISAGASVAVDSSEGAQAKSRYSAMVLRNFVRPTRRPVNAPSFRSNTGASLTQQRIRPFSCRTRSVFQSPER